MNDNRDGDPAVYHPDPAVNAEVAADALDAEQADLAAGYPPRRWRCPDCGAEHDRGFHQAPGIHRCLGCGYEGTGGIMFGTAPEPPAGQSGPAPLPGGDQPPTPGGFCAALTAAGLDAELLHHGGPGFPQVPTGYLPDGRGWILTDEDGGLGDADEPEVYGLPLPEPLYLGVYESRAENAPRWPDRQGLDFNDPVGMLNGCTAAEAAAALVAAHAGDYSAFTAALAGLGQVPACPAPPPLEWLRRDDGEPVFDQATRAYLRACRWAYDGRTAPWRTGRCPDCGQDLDGDGLVTDAQGLGHVLIDGAVVLGCDGLRVIDPEALGLPRGGWTDWRTGQEPDPADLDAHSASITDDGPGHGYTARLCGEQVGPGPFETYAGALAVLRDAASRRPGPLRVFYRCPAADLLVEFPVPLAEVREDWDREPRPEDVEWYAGLGDHIGVEAMCLLCGETCNPHGPDDMTHLARLQSDEEPCGGPLVPLGAWGATPSPGKASPIVQVAGPPPVSAAAAGTGGSTLTREPRPMLLLACEVGSHDGTLAGWTPVAAWQVPASGAGGLVIQVAETLTSGQRPGDLRRPDPAGFTIEGTSREFADDPEEAASDGH